MSAKEETIVISEEAMPNIAAFAEADDYLGNFVIAASSKTPEDRNLFEINERGVLTSRGSFDYELDRREYEFSVIYTLIVRGFLSEFCKIKN